MLAPAITLFFLLAPSSADPAASRQIAAPCPLIEERAGQYFEEHGLSAGEAIHDDEIIISLISRKDVSTPSAKPLSLNRSSIHNYTRHRHLSPMKTYDNFRLTGQLKLQKAGDSCNATLLFEFSAYEWAWPLAVIDDGYRSKFISNGELERLYIDSIGDLFTPTKP
jgi:hypothetical protein